MKTELNMSSSYLALSKLRALTLSSILSTNTLLVYFSNRLKSSVINGSLSPKGPIT